MKRLVVACTLALVACGEVSRPSTVVDHADTMSVPDGTGAPTPLGSADADPTPAPQGDSDPSPEPSDPGDPIDPTDPIDPLDPITPTSPPLWSPVLCAAAAAPSCAVTHELPVATHFSAAAQGFSFLAADAPSLYMPAGLPAGHTAGRCAPTYAYGLMPGVDDYPADTYTVRAPSSAEATQWAEAQCAATGFPVRHLRPHHPSGALAGTGPRSRSCELQVVHAALAADSLFTVLLPPGWDAAAPAGTYPIVFNGAYDLHDNVFAGHGPQLAALVGQSVENGGRGVIGVLWNGGGAYASRTASEHSLDLFAMVIAEVANRYRGNARWIVTFGGSRGGLTALRMAANPKRHPYRVVAAVALVPPTLLGDHAQLASVTYPPLLHAMGWSTGLQDAWRDGWTYPACGGRPELVGLRGWQAHLAVLTGTSDPAIADAQLSLAGPRYLDALRESGAQIYLGVGEHDFICPYAHQVALGLAFVQRSMPAQIEVFVRGGHAGVPGLDGAKLEEIVHALARPSLDLGGPVPPLVTPGVRYHRVDRATGQVESFTPAHGYPFSVDLPYYAVAGQRFPAVVVGEPGTGYALDVHDSQGVLVARLEGVVPAGMIHTHWVDVPADFPTGAYTWSATLARVDGSVARIAATATPTGAPCITTVIAEEPAMDYVTVMNAAMPPVLPSHPNTNWGLSEY